MYWLKSRDRDLSIAPTFIKIHRRSSEIGHETSNGSSRIWPIWAPGLPLADSEKVVERRARSRPEIQSVVLNEPRSGSDDPGCYENNVSQLSDGRLVRNDLVVGGKLSHGWQNVMVLRANFSKVQYISI